MKVNKLFVKVRAFKMENIFELKARILLNGERRYKVILRVKK